MAGAKIATKAIGGIATLLGGKPSAPDPIPAPPAPATAPPIPGSNDEALRLARKKKVAEAVARSGRMSTILTDTPPTGETLG